MECDICCRPERDVKDFLCTVCARTNTYLPRLEYAQILLEKDKLSQQVEKVVGLQVTKGENSDTAVESEAGQEEWQVELAQISINEKRRHVEHLKDISENVRVETAQLKANIRVLKDKIAERRKALSTIQDHVPSRRDMMLENVGNINNKATSSLLKLHQTSSDSRAQLCREAASLMRLRQRRIRGDITARDQFLIAGLTLPDLREISNLRCADLTAVLGSISHLTFLSAFYLGVKLPAEIVEPFPDHPLYTIFTPAASYRGAKPNFAETLASISQPNSPSASRHESTHFLQPRPLFIPAMDRDDRVFKFQKRDEQAFRYFTEALALLAWDVAWLCRSQGFTVGTNSWEDISNVGRNLHQLLVAHPHAPSIARIQSDRLLRRRSSSRKSATTVTESQKESVGRLGQHSDLSAYERDPAVAQHDRLASWDFLSWQKVAMPLRATLLTEIASAEWELLLDEEWDDGGEQFDEAVFVKTRTMNAQQYDDARSIMTTKTQLEDDVANGRIPGTSGWTKLKSRDKDQQ